MSGYPAGDGLRILLELNAAKVGAHHGSTKRVSVQRCLGSGGPGRLSNLAKQVRGDTPHPSRGSTLYDASVVGFIFGSVLVLDSAGFYNYFPMVRIGVALDFRTFRHFVAPGVRLLPLG